MIFYDGLWIDAAVMLVVRGLPAPQGSKRHVGHGVMVESSKKVAPWRQDVKAVAERVIDDSWVLLDGPLAVSMAFSFDRPKGHYRTGRNSHLLRDAAPTRPSGVPDLSKLLRSTEDALTGTVWKDDARIVDYVRPTGKWYAGSAVQDVLAVPGCTVRVYDLTSGTAAQ